jgi:hypothetical protein
MPVIQEIEFDDEARERKKFTRDSPRENFSGLERWAKDRIADGKKHLSIQLLHNHGHNLQQPQSWQA